MNIKQYIVPIVAALVLASVAFVLVPPPSSDQLTGTYDINFVNLIENNYSHYLNVSDRHQFLPTGEYGCTNCYLVVVVK